MITVAGVVAPTNQIEFWEDLGGRAYFRPNAFAKQTRGGPAVFVNAFDHEGAAISNAVDLFEGPDGLLMRAALPDDDGVVSWLRGSWKGASVALEDYTGEWQTDDDGPVFAIASARIAHITIATPNPVFAATRMWVVDDLERGRRVDGLTRYLAARWAVAWRRHCAVTEMRAMVTERQTRRAADNQAEQSHKLAAALSGPEPARWAAMAAIAAMPVRLPGGRRG